MIIELDLTYKVYSARNKLTDMEYIGKTKCLNCRFHAHLKDAGTNRTYMFAEALSYYGCASFEVTILHETDCEDKAYHLEEEEIKLRNTLFPNGYNKNPKGGRHTGKKKSW